MIHKSEVRDMAGNMGPAPASAEGAPRSFGLAVYRALTRMLRPAANAILKARERGGKEDPIRRSERIGVASVERPAGIIAWVHAASVGEANSILPLVHALGKRRGDVTFLLTTGTVTSARSVASRLPPRTMHQFVPLDAPQLVSRFLDYWHPSLAVFTEQEIWPNLVVETYRRKIPLALVNGRMSERSFARWKKRRRLARALFSRFGVVLTQSEVFAERFRGAGATCARSVGNLKIDAPPPPVDQAKLEVLNKELGDRPRILAASTHEGEERIIAAAHRLIQNDMPQACTLIVPRHPERGLVLARQLTQDGFNVALRSSGDRIAAGTEIYIADTIGELGTLYAAVNVAFIGGSLIAHGGQNPIEAVRLRAAVLTGPSRFNFEDAYDALLATGGVVEVREPGEIAAHAGRLLANRTDLDRMLQNADRALTRLSGALERTVEALLPLLPQAPCRGMAAVPDSDASGRTPATGREASGRAV